MTLVRAAVAAVLQLAKVGVGAVGLRPAALWAGRHVEAAAARLLSTPIPCPACGTELLADGHRRFCSPCDAAEMAGL